METRKTVVITGANSGIGLATARELAGKGFNIVTLCRKKGAGEHLEAELKQAYPNIVAKNYQFDLADLAGVKSVALKVLADFPVIDRLINNAGYYPSKIEYKDGIEASFYASHLGHMLLTLTLMPALAQANEARIINLSSALHSNGKTERFFKVTDGLSGMKAYGDAKLANMLFTIGLVSQIPENITAYSLHPGVVSTNIGADVTGLFNLLMKLSKIFMISPAKGAATSVFLATADLKEIQPHNGRYFQKAKVSKTNNAEATPANAKILWDKSMAFLKSYQ